MITGSLSRTPTQKLRGAVPQNQSEGTAGRTVRLPPPVSLHVVADAWQEYLCDITARCAVQPDYALFCCNRNGVTHDIQTCTLA